jgi:hypothetical protein
MQGFLFLNFYDYVHSENPYYIKINSLLPLTLEGKQLIINPE